MPIEAALIEPNRDKNAGLGLKTKGDRAKSRIENPPTSARSLEAALRKLSKSTGNVDWSTPNHAPASFLLLMALAALRRLRHLGAAYVRVCALGVRAD